MLVPKRLKAVVAIAKQHGWTYSETTSGHPRLTPPTGLRDPRQPEKLVPPVVFSKTPSATSGDRNAIALLRSFGLPIPR